MIRTRFSPSPTGLLHLGNVRAALFSALYATREHGAFLLRVEDTDAARSEEKFLHKLQDDLQWLGIHWQEGPDIGGPHAPYQQSQRHKIYDHYYQQLEKQALAYPCFCSDQELALNRKVQLSRGQAPRYPGTCSALSKEEVAKRITEGKKPTLRFRVPANIAVEFNDLVKGPQKFASKDMSDFIIRRAEGTASFLFCNAMDDSLMEITHVLRGEDHLANTPRQLMLLQALNMSAPRYGHLSLMLGEDGAPLSKRHGSFSLHDLRQQGFLPQAILNYLARISHTYEEQHLMSFAELAQQFRLEKLSRSAARFDQHQLLHWQKEAVMALDKAGARAWLGKEVQKNVPNDKYDLFVEVMRQNILFPSEAMPWIKILFNDELDYNDTKIAVYQEAGPEFFMATAAAIKQHATDLKKILDSLKTQRGVSGKQLFMPLRIALTGELHGPELMQIANLLGQEKMLQRVQRATELARK